MILAFQLGLVRHKPGDFLWLFLGSNCGLSVPRKVIQTAMKSKERAAILSTQYLEEVAAMCDRMAILVSGQLRWALGSMGASGRCPCPWQWVVAE